MRSWSLLMLEICSICSKRTLFFFLKIVKKRGVFNYNRCPFQSLLVNLGKIQFCLMFFKWVAQPAPYRTILQQCWVPNCSKTKTTTSWGGRSFKHYPKYPKQGSWQWLDIIIKLKVYLSMNKSHRFWEARACPFVLEISTGFESSFIQIWWSLWYHKIYSPVSLIPLRGKHTLSLRFIDEQPLSHCSSPQTRGKDLWVIDHQLAPFYAPVIKTWFLREFDSWNHRAR